MPAYVALLRGINVGGKNLINMQDLRTCLEDAGFRRVSTYINSGNVLFEATGADTQVLEVQIEKLLGVRFGFIPKAVVRSKEQIIQVIKDLPKIWSTKLDQKCNVIFLKQEIDSHEILNELSIKPDIEALEYKPGVLYWSAKTSDLTKSSMTKLSKSPFFQGMTVRNINTVRKINELVVAY